MERWKIRKCIENLLHVEQNANEGRWFPLHRTLLKPDETIDRLALWPNIVIQVLPYDAMTGELYEDFSEVEDPILSTEIRQQQQQQRQVTVQSDGTHVIEEELPRATGSQSLAGYMAPVPEGRLCRCGHLCAEVHKFCNMCGTHRDWSSVEARVEDEDVETQLRDMQQLLLGKKRKIVEKDEGQP